LNGGFELHGLRTLHLFAGAGGGILADLLLGHVPIGAVEIDPYCQQILSARQKDGILPWFPIFDDVQTFDGRPWRGLVDIVAGGFPCQDISCAGKGEGIEGSRSGLWFEMARIIGEIRPRFVFVENSPLLISRGLTVVLGDLAEMGFNARWCLLSASDCGAPHKRDRFWLVADSQRGRVPANGRVYRGDESEPGEDSRAVISTGEKVSQSTDIESGCSHLANFEDGRIKRSGFSPEDENQGAERSRNIFDEIEIGWPIEPDVGRVAHGVASRVDRLRALGNGQVPRVAARAWEILTEDA